MGEYNRRYPHVDPVIDGPHLSGTAGKAVERPYSVGSVLREAREDHGLELDEVARDLRIRLSYLQAIEDGRFTDLPGVAYATGFLRTYAEHLALDPDLVVRRFKEESSDAIQKAELYMPEPVPEGRIPGGTVLLLAVICAGAVYGGWYYMTSTGRELVDLVPPLPERLATMVGVSPSTPEVVVRIDDTRPDADVPAGAPVGVPAAGTPEVGAPEIGIPEIGTPEIGTEVAGVPGDDEVPDSEAAMQAPAVAFTGAATGPEAPAAEAPVAELPVSEPPVSTGTAAAPPAGDPAAGPVAGAMEGTGAEQGLEEPSGALADASNPGTEPAEGAVADRETPSGDGPVAEAPATEPAEAGQVAAVPPPPAPPAAPSAGEAPAPAGKVYGVVNGGSRIQLRAVQDSWVQVRDGSGDLLFARVLRPGDVYQVPDRGGLRMVTGNAGGLIAVVDGVAAGQPMGQTGQVMRDIRLDPQRFGLH